MGRVLVVLSSLTQEWCMVESWIEKVGDLIFFDDALARYALLLMLWENLFRLLDGLQCEIRDVSVNLKLYFEKNHELDDYSNREN